MVIFNVTECVISIIFFTPLRMLNAQRCKSSTVQNKIKKNNNYYNNNYYKCHKIQIMAMVL